MNTILNKIVTLIGDYENAGKYTLEGNVILREGVLIGTYTVDPLASGPVLKVSCINNQKMEAAMGSGKQLLNG